MNRMKARALLLATALPVALCACEGVKEELGLTKRPPDEFAVVASKAPLVVPPDFTLRPPRPGAPRPQEQQPAESARSALIASARPSGSVASPASPNEPAPQQFASFSPPGAPIVFGAPTESVTSAPAGPSAGEKALLSQAGALGVDPSIRDVVNRESAQLAEADRSFTEKLLFWQEPTPPGTVVDAEAEAKRLRENAAAGRNVSEGETPIVVRRKRGWLEGIF